jgi:putative oxidoreductase
MCAEKWQDTAPLVLRVALGLIFTMHGWQKFYGGVEGISGFIGSLGIPLPYFFAIVLIAVELIGGIMMILGVFTHWVSKSFVVVALVALFLVHIQNGFFIDLKGGTYGFEYILLILAASVSLMITGPGKWSLDNKMKRDAV